jgi:DNA-binding LacI/PurR family transcriptional regulator
MAVSLALNGRAGVSDELRASALKLADELGYRPNYAARALRTERTNMMGIINRNLRNPAFLMVIEGFDDECTAHGYQVMIGSSNLDLAHELALIDAFAARELEGLAIAPLESEAARRTWKRKSERPIAILNASAPRTDANVLSVRSDAASAVKVAVEHLRGLGHTRIALLTGTVEVPSDPERSTEFELKRENEPFEPQTIECGWDIPEARRVIGSALAAPAHVRPTAIIANSDHMAHAVYLAAQDNDLRIPDDLSVIGHDDVETSEILGPPLTTFRTDRYAIGRLSVRLLIDIAEGRDPGDRHLELPVELVVRGSTAPAPAG